MQIHFALTIVGVNFLKFEKFSEIEKRIRERREDCYTCGGGGVKVREMNSVCLEIRRETFCFLSTCS